MSEARQDPAAASGAPVGSGDPREAVHDDDELAAALQAQLERFAPSGSIPVVSPERAAEAGTPSVPVAPAAPGPAFPPADTASRTGPPDLDGRRPGWPSFAQAGHVAASHSAEAPGRPTGDREQERPSGRHTGSHPIRLPSTGSTPIQPTGSVPVQETPTAPVPLSRTASPGPSAPATGPIRRSAPATGPIAADAPVTARGSASAGPPAAAGPSAFAPPAGRPSFTPPPEPTTALPTGPPQPSVARSSFAPAVDAPPTPAAPAPGAPASPEPRFSSPVPHFEAPRMPPPMPPPAPQSPPADPGAAPVDVSTDSRPLEILEQIQPRLARVHLDRQTFQDWQQSLLEIGDAPPPGGSPPPPAETTPAPPTNSPAAVPFGGDSPAAVPFGADRPAAVPFGAALPMHEVPAPARPDVHEEVIHAELVDDEGDHPAPHSAPAPDPSQLPTTGTVQVIAGPVPATESAALAFRSSPAAPDGPPSDDGEVEPLPVDSITTDTGAIATGSVPILTSMLDRDLDDDVDDVVAPQELLADVAAVPGEPPADTGSVTPVPSSSVRAGVITIVAEQAALPALFSVEAADQRPTDDDQRLRRPVAQFWLWLAPNSSTLTLALGSALVAFGISFRQALVAAIVGVVVACLTLAVNVLAVKRTGQPVAVVSRAAFGLRGNLLPTAMLLLVRLFWASALTWLAASAVRSGVAAAGWNSVIAPDAAGLIVAVVFTIVACLIAVFGHGLLARVHLVLGVLAVVLGILLLVLTAPLIDMTAVLATADGSLLRLVAAFVAVLSLLAVAWASAGGELARYQNPVGSGTGTAGWASLGAGLPALLLTGWGLLLAASAGTDGAAAMAADPIPALLGRLPSWSAAPLLAAVVFGLLAAQATVLYSTGLTLGAVGLRLHRPVRTVAVAGVAVAAGIALLVSASPMVLLLRDVVPVLAVPVVAWTGIMAAEFFTRTRPFDSEALLRRGGRYPDVRWVNVLALAGIAVIGIGLVGGDGYSAAAGYFWRLFGVDPVGPLGQSDLGVPVALVLGLLVPLVLGRDELRRQEEAHVPVATLEE